MLTLPSLINQSESLKRGRLIPVSIDTILWCDISVGKEKNFFKTNMISVRFSDCKMKCSESALISTKLGSDMKFWGLIKYINLSQLMTCSQQWIPTMFGFPRMLKKFRTKVPTTGIVFTQKVTLQKITSLFFCNLPTPEGWKTRRQLFSGGQAFDPHRSEILIKLRNLFRSGKVFKKFLHSFE